MTFIFDSPVISIAGLGTKFSDLDTLFLGSKDLAKGTQRIICLILGGLWEVCAEGKASVEGNFLHQDPVRSRAGPAYKAINSRFFLV